MSLSKNDQVLKEGRNLMKKLDQTVKIKLLPEQLLIGNYHAALVPNKPLVFEFNRSGKLCIRFYLAGNLTVGYQERDFGVALTQIEHISYKEEQQENPAVLILTLKATCLERIYKVQSGLQAIVEKSLPENKRLTRDITLVLKPWPEQNDPFVKFSYQVLGEIIEEFYDFDVMRSLFKTEIKSIWYALLDEQWNRRARVSNNLTGDLLNEMDSAQWAIFLANHKICKKIGFNGAIRFVKSIEVPAGKRSIPVNSAAYDRGKTVGIPHDKPHTSHLEQERKIMKKRKRDYDEFAKLGHWRDRDVWVLEGESTSDDHQEIQLEPTFTEETRRRLAGRMEFAQNHGMMDPDNYENTNPIKRMRSNELLVPINFDLQTPVLQRHNGYNTGYYLQDFQQMTAVNHALEDVQQRMQHLGEEVDNVEMGDSVADYQFPELDPSNPYWQSSEPLSEFFVTDQNTLESLELSEPQGDFVVAPTPPQKTSKEPSISPSPPPPPPRRQEERVTHDTQLFTFPPNNVSLAGMESVVLTVKDVRTLDRKEFLNDNVMTFMVDYIRAYSIDPKLMSTIHMCNTFFYSNLTRLLPPLCFSGRKKPNDPKHETILRTNLTRVLRWTKNLDVFSKDYIVIPVNEDFHWLLIAVFNPSGAFVNLDDEAASRAAPKCYVVFFDPLSGLDPSKRNHMCHCVTTWLKVLYEKTKTPGSKFAPKFRTEYDPERVVVLRAKGTPVQDNFYDCGLYCLHFIEGLFGFPNKPVTVADFPDFDWSERYPYANQMCGLMRDKVYNLIRSFSNQKARSRLDRYERQMNCGLSREGELRKSRRHSAAPFRRLPRHQEYHPRHYSLNPPNRNLMMEDPTFGNPRAMVDMPITHKVRSLEPPEENFPIIY